MPNESEADYSAGIRGNNSRPETFVIINCVLNAPLMLISIIGNTLVLAAILRTPTLRSPSIVLLCSLAVSDLIVGFVVQPLYIVSKLTENVPVYRTLSIMAASSGTGLSLLIMTAISVDRFLALHYHMRYPNLITPCRAIYTSAVLWFISFLLSLLSLWKMYAYYFSAAIIIVICLLVSTGCYLRIYGIVRLHQLQIHVQQQAVESFNIENNQNMQRSTKSAKNTFIYYIVMVLCYTPLFIAMSVLFISPNHWTNMWILTDTIAFMNSSINPFLYCWRLRELRTAVVKTARHMLCKQTEEN
ncbi:melanocyte-stimulating hormone receptor-like [Oculina patagonica]